MKNYNYTTEELHKLRCAESLLGKYIDSRASCIIFRPRFWRIKKKLDRLDTVYFREKVLLLIKHDSEEFFLKKYSFYFIAFKMLHQYPECFPKHTLKKW